jgi:hypothetical protein
MKKRRGREEGRRKWRKGRSKIVGKSYACLNVNLLCCYYIIMSLS